MKRIIFYPLLCAMLLPCKNNDKPLKFTVEEAPEWTNLFLRKSGWFGGDGIFAIPLNGKENMETSDTTSNLFLFSDTMFGLINDTTLQPGYKMVNNSIAILRGHEPDISKINFKVLMDSTGNPKTLFIPKTPQTKEGDYFWLGDGFVNPANKALYIMAYRVRNIPEKKVFGFEVVGSVMIKIPQGSKYPYVNQVQTDLPLIPDNARTGGGNFGGAIFVNTKEANAPDPDGYIYVYSVTGKLASLVAARVLPKDFDDFSKWKFWDGKQWSDNMQNMASIVDGVSHETSITPIPGGKYAVVYQESNFSSKTSMRISDSPMGPFSDPYVLHDCAGELKNSNFFSYNAKAHPSISKPGELLISYNINSFDFDNDIIRYPNLYRPRMFRVIFK